MPKFIPIMEFSAPQIWLIAGLLMLFAELASVTLVFIFFAVGALATSLLAYMGVLPSLTAQVLTFSLISLLSLYLFRKEAKRLLNRPKSKEYNEYVGETAMVVQDITEQAEGKIFYRGAEWIALSYAHKAIPAGSKVIIRATSGIKLLVEEV
jgi:membrane protein implicated in regulation of membrane protease activity